MLLLPTHSYLHTIMLYNALLLVEDEPEFGQFFKDISTMLKEKTGETGENT